MRGLRAERDMGGNDGRAAAGEMGRQAALDALPGRVVEAGGGLVQQPERRRRGEQAGEAEPAALPGREQPRGKIGKRGEADRLQARRDGAAACKLYPEGEVPGHGKRWLHRIAMADIVEEIRLATRRSMTRRRRRPAAAPPAPEAGSTCPTPFGPVTRAVSPGASARSRSRNSSRPPRSQARPRASSISRRAPPPPSAIAHGPPPDCRA